MPYNPRNPSTFTVLGSAARTTTQTSAWYPVPRDMRGVRFFINSTASAATPSVVPTVEIKGPIASGGIAVLTGAAITGNVNVALTVAPGATAVTNVSTGNTLGRFVRIVMTAGDSDSLTYSIAGEWLP